MIEEGKFIPKWKHEYEMENGSIDKVRELQDKIMKYERTCKEFLEEIDRISDEKDDLHKCVEDGYLEIDKLNNEIVDSRDRGAIDNLTVFVNNEKYKII